MSRAVQLVVMLLAATLEVGGDAAIRSGMRGRGMVLIALGCAALAAYGIGLNLLPGDFSRLFGAYVAFFAVVSVVVGRVAFREPVTTSTWVGLAFLLVGSAVLQFARR
jgi:drug/metabolite transporter superfamily protein YnfA